MKDEQDAAIFTTAAFAGLRLGERRALRWCDADFDLRVVHVRRSYTGSSEDAPKSGRVRAVPMVDRVARALDDLSRRERFTAPGDLVFPGPEGDFMTTPRCAAATTPRFGPRTSSTWASTTCATPSGPSPSRSSRSRTSRPTWATPTSPPR